MEKLLFVENYTDCTFRTQLNIQKTKIMASGPITSWQIDRETVETVTLFWGAPKSLQMVTASHEIKTLTPWKTSYDQPRHHIKIRDMNFPTKVHLVKAMVFPVVMYGCESWIIKKAECRRTDAFEMWSWKRLLRVPWAEGDQISQS